MPTSGLKRRLSLSLMVFYGVGVMVGAGVYVLIGAVAGSAGIYAPLAFLLAGIVAAPTALSYAELSARVPEAAGEAAYVEASFGKQWLVALTGLSVVLVGSVSAAAVMRGGIGYLNGLISVDTTVAAVVMGGALITVALFGALESLTVAAVFTAIEVVGLLLVSGAGLLAEPSADWQHVKAP
ncbi:MAG: amino acid permease, partial [Granulosicoccaceae bacterium]